MGSFEHYLETGKVAETWIAKWLRKRGCTVMPVYEVEGGQFKGPQVYSPDREIVAPDMLVWRGKSIKWIEAKHKTAFSWYRRTEQWVTGIDLRHYFDYCTIDDDSPWPVWILFMHRGGVAKDSPGPSPSGLYGNSLEYLRRHESHRSDRWARGMVYWSIADLRLMDPGLEG